MLQGEEKGRKLRLGARQEAGVSGGARAVEGGWEGLDGRPRPVPCAPMWGTRSHPHHRATIKALERYPVSFLPFPASSILPPTEFDWTNIASVGRLVYNLKGMKTRNMRRFDSTVTLSQAPAGLSTQP